MTTKFDPDQSSWNLCSVHHLDMVNMCQVVSIWPNQFKGYRADMKLLTDRWTDGWLIIRNKSLWSYINSWHYVFFLWNLTTKTSHEIFYSTFYTFITILKWHLSLHTTKLLYSLISNTVHTTTIWQLLLLFNGNCMWMAQYMSIYLSIWVHFL